MKVASLDGSRRPIVLFPVFYDVPQHAIALDTFVQTTNEFSKLIESFNQDLFDGQIQYRIYVLPPEIGSFGQRLGVAVITGAAFVGGAITNSVLGDLGKGFAEGVVGQPLQEWGRQLGADARSAVLDWIDPPADKMTTTIDASELEQQAIAGGALVGLGQQFLSKPTEEFDLGEVSVNDFPDAFEAKNGFYEALEVNPQINGIGFNDFPEFPIRREEFQKRVVPVKREEEDDWRFEIVRLYITSPNWDRMDRQRGWKGRNSRGLITYFHIFDPLFWRRFDDGQVNSQNIDEIICQVAYKLQNNRKKNHVALNVISYNDQSFSPEVDELELRSRLEEYLQRSVFDTRQIGLF